MNTKKNIKSWDKYFMDIAYLASTRSSCLSRQVGAVIVKDKHIVSTGYNGPASGVKHCKELGGCIRRSQPDYISGAHLELCPASHAEQNAIAFAARYGISTDKAIMYITDFPCKTCINSIVNSGIKKIIYAGKYNAELTKRIIKESGIKVEEFISE